MYRETDMGVCLRQFTLPSQVISCKEAAMSKKVALKHELKSLIIETPNGLVVVNIQGDSRASLRSIKNALDCNEAYLASPTRIEELQLSPGTICPLLAPTSKFPQLISRKVLSLDFVTTNSGFRDKYFIFNPELLTRFENYIIGDFET